jgi:hypothetical protein
MKRAKTVTSRQFQHQFANVSQELKPGESITVTKHGKPLGTFIKAAKTIKAPDFMANLEKLTYSVQTGQKVIDEICGIS